MKRKRYSEEQIVRILGEADGGVPIAEVSRKYGVSEATIYAWRKKYAGMEVSDVAKMKDLETENRKLKKLLAETMLDKEALQDALTKKW